MASYFTQRRALTAASSRHAFTLIELLVVIAIIAVLAAILFPVFAQAREKARQTACMSNLRQVGMAVNMYMQDYDEHSVTTHHDLSNNETIASLYPWYQPLQSYIKNDAVFRCPSMNDTPTIFPNQVTLADWLKYRTDYLINGFFAHGIALASFATPSEQILFSERHNGIAFFDYHAWPVASDGNWERGFVDGSGYSVTANAVETQIKDPANVGRHSQGDNYTFADGHTKWFKFAGTLDRTKSADAVDNWGMHNRDNLPATE